MTWIKEDENVDSNLSATAKAVSITPRVMDAVLHINEAISNGASALTRVQEESIATVVSVANKCRY